MTKLQDNLQVPAYLRKYHQKGFLSDDEFEIRAKNALKQLKEIDPRAEDELQDEAKFFN